LVITCESCAMRFQLDDERVPESGIRVRCSRCEHAFFVKPAQRAGNPVAHAVNAALHADENSAQRPLCDAEAGSRPEENDWQFNRESERQTEGAETEAAQQGVDEIPRASVAPSVPDLEGDPEGFLSAGADVDDDIDALLGDSAGLTSDASQTGETETLELGLPGLDLAAFDSNERGADAPLDPLGAVRPEALSGIDAVASVDVEAVSPVDAEAAVAVDAEAAVAVDAEAAVAVDAEAAVAVDAEVAVAVDAEAVVPVDAEETASAGSGDGLGSPENWDFFASGETPAADGPSPQLPLARIVLGPPSELLPNPRAAAASDVEPPAARRWLGLAANGVGWAATAGMIVLLLQAGSPGLPNTVAIQAPVAGLEFENFTARSFDNAVVGPIRVVEGTVRATSGRNVAPGTRLAVQLLDAEGAVVDDDAATLGPALSEWMLREQPPAELREKLARRAGWSLAPGSARSVVAVIDAAPARAERFRIVAVPLPEASPAARLAESFLGD